MHVWYKDENAAKRFENLFILEKVDLSRLLEATQPDNIGTQQPSSGDSGTGHWIINTESKPSRAVLVAISTHGVDKVQKSQVQRVTHEVILHFIKHTLTLFQEL